MEFQSVYFLETNNMQIIDTDFDGVKIIIPRVWGDERGYFFETFTNKSLLQSGINIDFVQDNEALSTRGVLRGLHYQTGSMAQTKLVRVSRGRVLDVIVDLRPESETYGKHFSIILSDENKKQLLVPKGFAHGYVVLSDEAVFLYKCDNYYDKDSEGGVYYADPNLNIDWQIDLKETTVSQKDKNQPLFGDHKSIK